MQDSFTNKNPQERSPVKPKNRIWTSVLSLVLLPNKMAPYWNLLIFVANYTLWVYMDRLFLFFGISTTVPIFNTFWTSIIWGMFVLFISAIFFTSTANRLMSLKILLNLKNSAVTFAANVTLYGREITKKKDYNKLMDLLIAYLYLIKNVNRKKDISLRKLPLDMSEMCEIANYSELSRYLKMNDNKTESGAYMIDYIDSTSMRTNARWEISKGDLYLEAIYAIILKYKAVISKDAGMSALFDAGLSGLMGGINTMIDEINGVGIMRFSTFLKELFVYASYGSLILIAPIYYQTYGLWWGFFFYMFTYILSFGAVLIAYKLNDPFEDPDVNPYNAFGKSAGRLIDDGVASIRYHQYQGLNMISEKYRA